MILKHPLWTFHSSAYISGQTCDGKVSKTEQKSNAEKDEESRIGQTDVKNIQDHPPEKEIDTGT